MMHRLEIQQLLAFALLAFTATGATAESPPAVNVFILAGQSNMEGKAADELFDYQATHEPTQAFFAHLRSGDRWIERDDVFIKFLDRHGPLTIGYGSPGRTGAELAFGTMMGDHFDEPVLLIKAAWGGRSLVHDFRPPSAGLPGEDQLRRELDEARQRVEKNNQENNRTDPLPTLDEIKSAYGWTYRDMLAEIQSALENYETLFPTLQGHKPELAGFVWFQGWNDQYGGQDEYEANLPHFIRDVRRDLNAPAMPIVIAAMGQNGSRPAEGAMLTIQKAQLAMNDVPEFQGNVRAFRTDELIDKAAEELYPRWEQETERWKLVGSDHPYHYLGSAIWFTRIGRGMGDAMLELLSELPKDAGR
jgi:hypothetical protein